MTELPPSVEPAVLAGRVLPLLGEGWPSAIAKYPVAGPWRVTFTGLADDEQADRKNHGGREKALHQYPQEHYAAWADAIGPHPLLSAAGAFGENLSTLGWNESNMCIGDIVGFGSALLQVSQGRQPCWKLNVRFARDDMALAVQSSGRTGWYYRVLKEGMVASGDHLRLEDRPQPHWPLSRIIRLLYVDTQNTGELAEMSAIPELAEGWRNLAARRIKFCETEDWSARLGDKRR